MSGAATAVAIGAAIGAAVGGISAAVQGGDIGMGILGGAAGGALTGGIASPLGGALGGGLSGSIGGGLIAGAAGGALNSAITGGDIASGALMGGAMGGVMGGFNYASGPSINADGSVGVGSPDVTGAGASSVDASGAATGAYNQPLSSGYGAGDVGNAAISNPTGLDAMGSGQIAQPASPLSTISVEPLGVSPQLNNAGFNLAVDPAQLSQAQQILQTQGPTSPAFQSLPTDVKMAAVNVGNLTVPAAPSATTISVGGPSTGPTGGLYDTLSPMQRMAVTADNGLANIKQAVMPSTPTPPGYTGPTAAAPAAPWGNTGNAMLDKGLNWVQGNKSMAAMGGLGVLSMLGGSGQPTSGVPATAATATPTSKYWNSQLPQYSMAPRTVTAAPAAYQPYKQGEWLYFPAQQAQPVAMAKGGRVASSKGGLGALGTGRRLPPGGQDDRVHAVLAEDEYVVPADVVAHLGDGSSNAGGARLDHMVKSVRSHKASTGSKFPQRARSPLAYAKG
jgi:hypothetical protein